MNKTEFQGALTERKFEQVPGRMSHGPTYRQSIKEGHTMQIIVNSDNVRVSVACGPDMSWSLVVDATFYAAGRGGAFDAAFKFVESYL